MNIFYDCLIFTWGVLSLPKLLKRSIRFSEERDALKQKLGLALPPKVLFQDKRVIWIHSVSLGETKAAEPLIKKIKQSYPNACIVCSHSTTTGLHQSGANPLVDYSFILPIDLRFLMNKLTYALSPFLFILVESDLWPNLLSSLQAKGSKIAYINGKLSKKSYKRHSRFPFFINKTLRFFDLVIAQNSTYEKWFLDLGSNPLSTYAIGNLKFDITKQMLESNEKADLRQKLCIPQSAKIITFGCTHPKEEEIALSLFKNLQKEFKDLFLVIAPRHPYRIGDIKQKVLKNEKISTYSYPQQASILLIDQIGVLDSIYQISDLVVLGGSFIKRIGGHNLLEPLQAGATLLYGPYIDKQFELDELIQSYGAGIKLKAQDLYETVQRLLLDQGFRQILQDQSKQLLQSTKGVADNTFEKIEKIIEDNIARS